MASMSKGLRGECGTGLCGEIRITVGEFGILRTALPPEAPWHRLWRRDRRFLPLLQPWRHSEPFAFQRTWPEWREASAGAPPRHPNRQLCKMPWPGSFPALALWPARPAAPVAGRMESAEAAPGRVQPALVRAERQWLRLSPVQRSRSFWSYNR